MQRLTPYCTKAVMGLLGGFLLVLGSSGLSYADHFPAEAVSTTKHNLASNTNIGFGTSSGVRGSSEVCIYCHTPHGAGYGDQLNLGMAPLWNRKINTSVAYTVYDSPQFDGGTTLNGLIKGVSLACLSCHDGTIAFDALINLPGSGGYVPANATAGTVPGDHALADTLFGGFTSTDFVDATNHTFDAETRSTSIDNPSSGPFAGSLFTNNTLIGQSGTLGTRPFPNLTTDLRDDHPISFEIPAGSVDPQFSELELGATLQGSKNLLDLVRRIGGDPGVLPDDPRDRIRAYPSTGLALGSGSVANAYIECASCHNPHTPRTLFLRLPSNIGVGGGFATTGAGLPSGGSTVQAIDVDINLRTYWSHAPNQLSAICTTCHQK